MIIIDDLYPSTDDFCSYPGAFCLSPFITDRISLVVNRSPLVELYAFFQRKFNLLSIGENSTKPHQEQLVRLSLYAVATLTSSTTTLSLPEAYWLRSKEIGSWGRHPQNRIFCLRRQAKNWE